MADTAVVEFFNEKMNSKAELEIPLTITANELIIALNAAFGLGLDIENIFNCHLAAESPVAFIRGNRLLSELGIRNGTRIYFAKGA